MKRISTAFLAALALGMPELAFPWDGSAPHMKRTKAYSTEGTRGRRSKAERKARRERRRQRGLR